MKYCEKCKVKIRTSHEKCPLCQGVIQGEKEGTEEIFPEIKEKNRSEERRVGKEC